MRNTAAGRSPTRSLAITTAEGCILYLGLTYQGSVHDKILWDQADVGHTPLNLLAELGFARL